ncbi:MAG: DUF4878 domain-containing protein [Pyrinomonadaceae bacterium]
MKIIIFGTLLAASIIASACGGAKTASNTAAANKPADSKPAATTGGASETVKTIYANAIKRDCAAIPPMLTEDFKKAVGTSKDALEALCDSLTDSGKVTAITVTGETVTGDSATVKVEQKLKDGKTENKEERMKKSGDKWLMDS